MADAHSQSQPISPILHPVAVAELRPTQITVGMREAELKRHEWRALAPSKGSEFLGRHLVPVVRGPKDRPYVIDHHHLARALHEEGVKDVLVSFVADLRKLDKDSFWSFLDTRGWMHPFDSEGKRQPRTAIPKSVADLEDDPYRSLAGELRFSGGYAKDVTLTANSCGPRPCAGVSAKRWRASTSTRRCAWLSNSPKAAKRLSCRAGAGRMSGPERQREAHGVF
jgi:hypothetical protein